MHLILEFLLISFFKILVDIFTLSLFISEKITLDPLYKLALAVETKVIGDKDILI